MLTAARATASSSSDALVIASFKGASFVPGALVLGGNASNLGGRPLVTDENQASSPGMDIACDSSSWWLGVPARLLGVWSESYRLGGEIARVHGGIKARETSIAGLASMCLANPRSHEVRWTARIAP